FAERRREDQAALPVERVLEPPNEHRSGCPWWVVWGSWSALGVRGAPIRSPSPHLDPLYAPFRPTVNHRAPRRAPPRPPPGPTRPRRPGTPRTPRPPPPGRAIAR